MTNYIKTGADEKLVADWVWKQLPSIDDKGGYEHPLLVKLIQRSSST